MLIIFSKSWSYFLSSELKFLCMFYELYCFIFSCSSFSFSLALEIKNIINMCMFVCTHECNCVCAYHVFKCVCVCVRLNFLHASHTIIAISCSYSHEIFCFDLTLTISFKRHKVHFFCLYFISVNLIGYDSFKYWLNVNSISIHNDILSFFSQVSSNIVDFMVILIVVLHISFYYHTGKNNFSIEILELHYISYTYANIQNKCSKRMS